MHAHTNYTCYYSLQQMKLGEVSYVKDMLEIMTHSVHPHSQSNINIPGENISKIHTEKAALLHNCLTVSRPIDKSVQNWNSRDCIR